MPSNFATLQTNDSASQQPSYPVTFAGDVIGGITTFFTMAQIVVVNPGILASQGTGMAFSGVLTATVVLAFAMTLMMGLYAAAVRRRSWHGSQRVLYLHDRVAAAGPVASRARDRVLGWRAVPDRFRDTPFEQIALAIPPAWLATAGGIGLLLTLIGLRNAGLIESDPAARCFESERWIIGRYFW